MLKKRGLVYVTDDTLSLTNAEAFFWEEKKGWNRKRYRLGKRQKRDSRRTEKTKGENKRELKATDCRNRRRIERGAKPNR